MFYDEKLFKVSDLKNRPDFEPMPAWYFTPVWLAVVLAIVLIFKLT